jgi:DNA-binding NarL/FixJ family response regulator
MRIVVADNDPAVLDLLTIDLELEGHDIVGVAPSGAVAIALCEQEIPDALVVDYRMPPGPNGVEVARAVGRAFPSVRVIVYSNYEESRVINGARKAGAKFVAKGDLRLLRKALTEAR